MRDIVCVHCKYAGRPGKRKRGSTWLEALGWMVFPLGLPYTIWRMFSKQPVCKQCGSDVTVRADSIMGLRLARLAATGHDLPAIGQVNMPQEPVLQPRPTGKTVQDPELW